MRHALVGTNDAHSKLRERQRAGRKTFNDGNHFKV